MEILCKREDLLEGIQMVQPVVSTKGTLPILANILLEAKGKDTPSLYKLNMTATDLEVGIICPVMAQVAKEGTITVPARAFLDVVRELPSEEVKIKVDEKNRMRIGSGQAVFNLAGLPKEDYPVLPEFKTGSDFLIDRKLLGEMFRKVIFSVSRDETRYILCGVYFQLERGKIKMVSTDGRRLSCISKNIETNLDEKEQAKAIIPTKAVVELNRILGQSEAIKKDDKARVHIGKNQISFALGPNNIVLISRLIEGNFPDYKEIIPKKSDIKIKMKTEDLLGTTRRVAVLTTNRSISVKYLLEENKLTARANTEGLGEAQDIMGIDYKGRRFETAYDPRFLIDVLRNIDCDEVYLELTEPLKPCLIRPASEEDYISIIMPMRI